MIDLMIGSYLSIIYSFYINVLTISQCVALLIQRSDIHGSSLGRLNIL